MITIKWKKTGDLSGAEWYAIINGIMVIQIATTCGPLYYVHSNPSVKYESEQELIDFLSMKHNAI